MPAASRIVVVEDPRATLDFRPRPEAVRRMVEAGLQALARTNDTAAAWRRFIGPEQTVGIKVHAAPGPLSGTRPAVVEALVRSLLEQGHSPDRIVIWDKHRENLEKAGFVELGRRLGVAVEGAVEAGYDPDVFYDNPIPGELVWGDLEFQPGQTTMGRRSHVTRLLTGRIDRLITVTPLLNHNQLGVSGALFNLALGSVDNTRRFLNDPERLAVAIPEICALPAIADRTAFHVVDALIAQYYGQEESLLHYATILNQLRFSTDPVALDLQSIAELARQRQRAGQPKVEVSLAPYHNAGLLELGAADPERIVLETLRLAPADTADRPPALSPDPTAATLRP
ncbi:MAG: DUF362 domain-containing protein [Verrucomicrobia bacterium]|nr:MAG: DUF362 domain-containing protein [Verrucomicrobiota bacterium]